MSKVKDWYLKLICYDPIIESLNKASSSTQKKVAIQHSASPINPNRKQKKEI